MKIIGRRNEQRLLESIVNSGVPEFVVVYGRRRVGKTYLIGEFFENKFSFRATGLAEGSMKEQLAVFAGKLQEYGSQHTRLPHTWIEAFSWLRELLQDGEVERESTSGRRIVFIDELPWFDTPRSAFKTALEFFWNDWACTQEDLVLIVCGSATSWLADNLLETTRGLYNRVTRVIGLQPFSLGECGEYLAWRGVTYSPRQVVECYMVFGGIPYYLSLQDRSNSLTQNVDSLLFHRSGQLVPEFERLYRTLFRNPEPYVSIIRALASKRCGMTRAELLKATGLEGGKLSTVLKNLDLCGFIRAYRSFGKRQNDALYQLIDPFSLFYLTFVDSGRLDGWSGFSGSPAYHAWTGLAFELVCLLHVEDIKRDLGISGVQTNACAWRSRHAVPAAQIDLLIDRRDDVISLCEMKYSEGSYALSAGDERSIRNKIVALRDETGTRKAIHPTLVTLEGATHNAHFNSVIVREVCIADWLA